MILGVGATSVGVIVVLLILARRRGLLLVNRG